MPHAERNIEFHLRSQDFVAYSHLIANSRGMSVTAFRYPSGVEALRVENARGHIIVLPFMGQIIWAAEFDGVDLTMGNRFTMPRPVSSIVETYGCFAFHSGILRNGCPSPQDTHVLHGEMACARMAKAGLLFGHDEQGNFVEITGEYEYVMGFGAHYLARPSVRFYADKTHIDVTMDIENLSSAPMELMYMCHVNFAYARGARIVQPLPYTRDYVQVRSTVPSHVVANDDYLSLIDALADDPSLMAVLDEPQRYDPEQVFYIRGLPKDAHGNTHMMMQLPDGDGFAISYSPDIFPKTVRWILVNGDAQVAAFALPATCEPEGYLAEKSKGNIRILASGERAVFPVRIAYLDASAAEQFEAMVNAL